MHAVARGLNLLQNSPDGGKRKKTSNSLAMMNSSSGVILVTRSNYVAVNYAKDAKNIMIEERPLMRTDLFGSSDEPII